MKAARISGPGQIESVEVPEPTPSTGQVLIRMVMGAICGSDLHHLHEPYSPDAYPLRPGYSGHECVGVVELGDGKRFHAGDRVLVLPPHFDGFAEKIACEPRWLLPLPDALPWEEAVLSQQLGTVLYCAHRLAKVEGSAVVILGQGPAGLLFAQWLRARGARTVIGVDVLAHRLAVAQTMGATHVIDASREDPVDVVLQRLPKGADIVIEAVGNSITLNQVPKLVREGGQIAYYGIPPKGEIAFQFEVFFRRYATTITSARAQLEPGLRAFQRALEGIASGAMDVTPLISHQVPLSEIRRGFELAEKRPEGAIKILLQMHH